MEVHDKTDSVTLNQFTRHIYSLDYIVRKADNSNFFLNLSDDYCDSILALDSENTIAQSYKQRNNLIRSTCSENLNYKIRFYSLFAGIPAWMGFADDPIEYAYDHALEQLLVGKYFQLYNGPLGQANISSIIINANCDAEMFEIGNQTVIKSSDHLIVPQHELERIIGKKNTEYLLNGKLSPDLLDKICDELNLERLGIFTMRDIDVINGSIWLVESQFQLFSTHSGFSDSVAYKGFTVDKRSVSIIPFILYCLFSLIIIALMSFASVAIFKYRKMPFISATELLQLYLNQISFVFKCFPVPIGLALIISLSLSILTPAAGEHFLEFSSKLWTVLLIIGISLVPITINLFFVNRLKIDGFHTIRGYRLFSVTSIFSVGMMFSLFSYIENEKFPYSEQAIVLIAAVIIGDLIARSYFLFSSVKKNVRINRYSIFGLLMSALFLIILNGFLLISIVSFSPILALFVIACCSAAFYLFSRSNGFKEENDIAKLSAGSRLNDVPYVTSLVNPDKSIYGEIQRLASDNELNVMLVSGHAGIGKTRSIQFVKKQFIAAGWDWYYGDCDETQNVETPSFEPFLEAFKELLEVDGFSDRGEHINTVVGSAVEIGASLLPSDPTVLLKPYTRSSDERMTETCIEIIEKLEKRGKNLVFVMEDMHWIDSESYALFKLFIQVINRNTFARSKITILLTIREDRFTSYRGPNITVLKNDLDKLQSQSSNKFTINTILNSEDFKLQDFLLQLNNREHGMRLNNATLLQLNEIFNEAIEYIQVTPLYILNTIENWIVADVLHFTNDGFKLTRQISIDDLPSELDADKYYNKILSNYEEKWIRLLESAAIIGDRFNAELLAKVWNYELLEVLGFLEIAVKDKLLIDVSKEDNIFVFGEQNNKGSGKRIVNAIKVFYQPEGLNNTEKQITIEYNKRYIALHSDVLTDLANVSTEDLIIYLRRLCALISSQHYLSQARVIIFEIVVRLMAQDLFEKVTSFSSTLNGYPELENCTKIIDQLTLTRARRLGSVWQTNNITTLQDSYDENEILRHQQSTLTYDLLLLLNLIKYSGNGTNKGFSEEQQLYLETDLLKTHAGTAGIFLVILLADVKYTNSQCDEKINFLVAQNEILKPNIIGQYLSRVKEIYLQYKKSTLQPKDTETLNLDSLELLNTVKTNPSLWFLRIDAFNLRFDILSNILDYDDQVILEFRNALIEDFTKKDYAWLKVVLNFLNSYSADIYFKKYPEEARLLVDDCEEIAYKYVDDKTWNKLVRQLLGAKSLLESSQGNFKISLQHIKKSSDLMISNNRSGSKSYRELCTQMAGIYENMGEGLKSIEKRLESIEFLKDEMNQTQVPSNSLIKELSVDYNNISHVYRNHLDDNEKALKYSKLSLELKTPEEGKGYGISLYNVGRAYDALGKFKEALHYYQDAEPYFHSKTPRDTYQKSVLQLNIGLAMVQSDQSASRTILNNAVASLQKKEFSVYLTTAIKERLALAVNLL